MGDKFFVVKDRYGQNQRLLELADWEKLPYDRQLDSLDGLARDDYRRALEALGLTEVSLKIERKRQAGRRARNLKVLEAMFSDQDVAFVEAAEEAIQAGGIAPKSRSYIKEMIAEARRWPKPAPAKPEAPESPESPEATTPESPESPEATTPESPETPEEAS